MLVNLADNEVQLIDIETAEIVRRFLGQKQVTFVIRSSFGGADENLIISGSEGICISGGTLLRYTNFTIRFENLHMAQGKRHFD